MYEGTKKVKNNACLLLSSVNKVFAIFFSFKHYDINKVIVFSLICNY